MTAQNLVTHAEIIVPFDGDELKAQRLANVLAANAGDLYILLKEALPHLPAHSVLQDKAIAVIANIEDKVS